MPADNFHNARLRAYNLRSTALLCKRCVASIKRSDIQVSTLQKLLREQAPRPPYKLAAACLGP